MYFSYDYDNGITFHKTKDAARKAAKRDLREAHDIASDDGWPENVEDNCWGKIIEHMEIVDREPASPLSEFSEFIQYDLVRPEL